MSTEKRPYEETICIKMYSALIAADLGKQDGNIIFDVDVERFKEYSKCLGPKCQMYNVNFKGCGLRIK